MRLPSILLALAVTFLPCSADAVKYGNPLNEQDLPPEGRFAVMIHACRVKHVGSEDVVKRESCRWLSKPFSAYGPVMCMQSAWTVAQRWRIEQAALGHDYFIEEWHCADPSENGI